MIPVTKHFKATKKCGLVQPRRNIYKKERALSVKTYQMTGHLSPTQLTLYLSRHKEIQYCQNTNHISFIRKSPHAYLVLPCYKALRFQRFFNICAKVFYSVFSLAGLAAEESKPLLGKASRLEPESTAE